MSIRQSLELTVIYSRESVRKSLLYLIGLVGKWSSNRVEDERRATSYAELTVVALHNSLSWLRDQHHLERRRILSVLPAGTR